MGSQIQQIEISKLERNIIYRMIDLAGFKVVSTNHGVTLEDKTSREADKYSDLTFKSLVDAAIAISPYVRHQFKLVA